MYVAEGDKIYYCNPNETGSKELFVTVHQTKDILDMTVEKQAVIIADMLNDL